MITSILHKPSLTHANIVQLLEANEEDTKALFAYAAQVKEQYIGKKVYLRGLIEFSNVCEKDCYYCGIRKSNKKPKRFNVSDEAILSAARFAYEHNYASLALQSGELQSPAFTTRVERLLYKIQDLSQGTLGVTLSCGEQNKETYQRWKQAGASRYLLRIESTDEALYQKLHPNNSSHSFHQRIERLHLLKELGYQTGTGVMIGLPFQTTTHLANDLLFMQNFDIDMCGMGPYIVHEDTPLFQYASMLLPLQKRLELSLKMVAILRILMKDINIAATTALQAISPTAREQAVEIGANVLMPNITPGSFRDDYHLYQNKPKSAVIEAQDTEHPQTAFFGNAEIGFGKCGDSPHFFKKQREKQSE